MVCEEGIRIDSIGIDTWGVDFVLLDQQGQRVLEGSKFEYIEQECGILIGGNYESLTPVLADRLLARQMKVAEHTPLLRI